MHGFDSLPCVFFLILAAGICASCTYGDPSASSGQANDDLNDDIDDDVDDDSTNDDVNDDANDDIDDDEDDDIDDDVNDDTDDGCDDDLIDDDTVWLKDANECCLTGDPCGFADNRRCECPLFAWDRGDCRCCDGVCPGLWPNYVMPSGVQVGEYYYEEIEEGGPGLYGTASAKADDGTLYIAASTGRTLYVYNFHPDRGWDREVVDHFADWPTMIMDSNGKLHIAYYSVNENVDGRGFKYATNAEGSWRITLILSANGYWNGETINLTSMTLDEQDRIHISFYNNLSSTNGVLIHATTSADDWILTPIVSGELISHSISATPDGSLHVAFSVAVSYYQIFPFYATNEMGAWTVEVIEYASTTGHMASASSPDGSVHVTYTVSNWSWDNVKMRYARRSPFGIWIKNDIPSTESIHADGPAMVTDADGNLHEVYSEYDLDSDLSRSVYISNETGAWEEAWALEDYTALELSTALSIDANEKLHWTLEGIYATNEDGYWKYGGVDAQHHGFGVNKIILDENDRPHLFIYPRQNKFHVMREDDAWIKLETLPDDVWRFVSSVEMDTEGFIHLSREFASCYYVTNKTGEWIEETFNDDEGCQRSQLAIDYNNTIIAVYQVPYHGLMVSKKDGEIWETEEVTNYTGCNPKVEMDESDNIHAIHCSRDISGSDSTVAYTTNYSGEWATIGIAEEGRPSDIMIDDDGYIHVLYEGYYQGDLFYTTNKSGEWITSTLDTGTIEYSTLAVDENGAAHVVSDSNYYTNKSGEWITTKLPEKESHADIEISGDGYIHKMSYSYWSVCYARFPVGWSGE